MKRFTATIFGKPCKVNKIALVLILLFTIFIWVTGIMGIFKFGGWLAILALIATTFTVTLRGKVYTLIPFEKTKQLVSNFVIYAGVLYYFFG